MRAPAVGRVDRTILQSTESYGSSDGMRLERLRRKEGESRKPQGSAPRSTSKMRRHAARAGKRSHSQGGRQDGQRLALPTHVCGAAEPDGDDTKPARLRLENGAPWSTGTEGGENLETVLVVRGGDTGDVDENIPIV